MKNTIKIILLTTCLSCLSAYSQTTCNDYLNDFIPKSTDSVVEVNVRFHLMTNYYGVWDANDTSRAVNCIRLLDSIYSHISAPAQTISGVSYIPHARIKFKLKGFSLEYEPIIYFNDTNPDPALLIPHLDSNALNLFFVYGSFNHSTVQPLPSLASVYPAQSASDIGSLNNAQGVAHEIGHMLGLDHSSADTVYDLRYSPPRRHPDDGPLKAYPVTGCCSTLTATDYVLADTIIYRNCGDHFYRNNLMDEAIGCLQYLSPQQMAVMHYHLRTDLIKILTPYSYNNHLGHNAAADFTVTSAENWTNDRYSNGHITVAPGVKLTINCQLALAKDCRIFVKKTGQLVIDGGTVTNISGHHWASILVEGDPAQDQSYDPTSGFATSQGMLRIKNGAMLTHAGTATGNYITNPGDTIIWTNIGGIIIATDANFIDNARDAEFLSYNLPSGSFFKNCQFKTQGIIGDGLLPFAHVSMCEVSNVRFMGCNFEYAASSTYTTHGMGLWSIDAQYSVDKLCGAGGTLCATPTYFKNLDRGAFAINSNLLKVASINNCRFEKNIYDGANFLNMNTPIFNNNYIQTPSAVFSNGLYLNQCKYYTIKNNTFEEEFYDIGSTGMFANKSRDGSHQVYRNVFSGFTAALNAINNNGGGGVTGLKMNCNDFTQQVNRYDIAVVGSGTGTNAPRVNPIQGYSGGLATATNVVRNMYGATCGNANKWYVTSYTDMTYIVHGCNSDAVTQPTPQPSCSSNILNIWVAPFPLTYTANCPANLPSGGGGTGTSSPTSAETIANINTYMSALRTSSLDPDTFELQATMSAKLNYFLTDTLPDSKDTVIQILSDNFGFMKDADIQLVFAYLNKQDYGTAAVLAGSLGTSRDDWRDMFAELIEIYQETEGIFCLANTSGSHFTFMNALANSEGKDGQSIAQALLKFVNGTDYDEPRPLPDEGGLRTMPPEGLAVQELEDIINIYPNPAQAGVIVYYHTKQEGKALVEVKDLLGRDIYSNFINNTGENYVPLINCGNGVYFITVTKDKELLYKTKLVKTD